MPRKKKPKFEVDQTHELETAVEPTTEPQPETQEAQTEPIKISHETEFPIVGIGASAGGLEAFEKFFANTPADTGMAFVLVQHLSAPHKSILADLVQRHTSMVVRQVTDQMKIEPNCVYIIPPNTDMALLHGHLHLMEPNKPRGLRLPIDFFFQSLFQDQHEKAICVVLSGMGTDGTLGVKAIKGGGGMAMAQDPATAKFDGMPVSAIQTNQVDFVLPPEKMSKHLITFVEHAFRINPLPAPDLDTDKGDDLQKIFIILRAQTGHDFSYYKQNTIRRRIERRMVINQIEKLNAYVLHLQKNPLEVTTLFREILIGVTNFFRDPEAFEILAEKIIPGLFESHSLEQSIRVWIPACSTGEEAYSLAILLKEQMDALKRAFKIQIFATDIDSEAIQKARSGSYPNGIVADVSTERLERYFSKENDSYRIRKEIRNMVVFAEQNIIGDPPFSKIDLISCRNLLIYLQGTLQKKVLPLFHYSLKPDGVLFLGNSETIGEFKDLFFTENRKWRIYRRKGILAGNRPIFGFPPPPFMKDIGGEPLDASHLIDEKINLADMVAKTLLQRHTPTCVIVNEKGEVLYTHGRTGKYLEPASGEASLSILRMAREGLRMELTAALRKSMATKMEVIYRGLKIKSNGDCQTIDLIVNPVTKPLSMQGLMMVIFEDVVSESSPEALEIDLNGPVTDKDQRIMDLELELRTKDEYLQTAIEELETSNEELKSTNEEMQSSNEELQSTNEELETSKEEMQSINEELVTVNSEYKIKIDELSQATNDMSNLLASTGVGTIFLNMQLCIQWFTPEITKVINLIPTDIGRPIGHIMNNFKDYAGLVNDAQAVLDTLLPYEIEVQTENGQNILMRIIPYRTVDNVIEGVVLTFVDVSHQKQIEADLQTTEIQFRLLFENSNANIIIYDTEGQILRINKTNAATLGGKPDDFVGKSLHDIFPKQADYHLERFAKIMKEKQGAKFEDLFPLYDGVHWFSSDLQPMLDVNGEVIGIQIVAFDITERKLADIVLRESEINFRRAAFQSGMIFSQVDNDLRYIWIYDPRPDFDQRTWVGKQDIEIEDNASSRQLMELKRQVIATGQIMRQKIDISLSDGDHIYAVIAEPLFDVDGQVNGLTTYSVDITEPRQWQAE
jgi:two-component system, chemotaxis family, CheB/CheR fusion protein